MGYSPWGHKDMTEGTACTHVWEVEWPWNSSVVWMLHSISMVWAMHFQRIIMPNVQHEAVSLLKYKIFLS